MKMECRSEPTTRAHDSGWSLYPFLDLQAREMRLPSPSLLSLQPVSLFVSHDDLPRHLSHYLSPLTLSLFTVWLHAPLSRLECNSIAFSHLWHASFSLLSGFTSFSLSSAPNKTPIVVGCSCAGITWVTASETFAEYSNEHPLLGASWFIREMGTYGRCGSPCTMMIFCMYLSTMPLIHVKVSTPNRCCEEYRPHHCPGNIPFSTT